MVYYNEIRESNINMKEPERYTLETSGWKHLSGPYIFVKSKIKNN
jgi:hypothetical protein